MVMTQTRVATPPSATSNLWPMNVHSRIWSSVTWNMQKLFEAARKGGLYFGLAGVL